MRNYIIMLLFLHFLTLNAQNTDYLKPLQDLIPKTPEAAALSKFLDIPPGNYTGTSSFSVPIHTIDMFGTSLPISLDYHASGVKVGDVSSRIGLGWSMNVGGISLSKQIVGLEDTDHILSYDVVNFNPIHQNISDNDYFIAQTVNGCANLIPKDTQPDIYSFSIGGESGKFVIDSGGAIHLIPYGETKIERTSGLNFTITNSAGVKFYFTNNGNQYTLGANGFSNNGHTNFKITEILLLNGERIFFNYRTTGIGAKYMINRMHSQVIEAGLMCSDAGLESFELNTSEVFEGLLTSIVFNQGSLIFKYSDEKTTPEFREDVANDVYCFAIQLKNSNNLLIKDFSLTQSYFISPGYVADPYLEGWETWLEPLRKASYFRLKLDSIIENNSQANYGFEYHQEYNMPDRLSYDTDYWGFYNGANNLSDLPRVLFNNRFIGVASREPNINYGKTCALKKITFPTGGFQEFFYENDDFYYSGLIENYTPANFEINSQNGANFNQNYSFVLNGDVDQVLEFTATPNPLNSEPEGNSLPNVSSYIYGVVLNQNMVEIERIYLNGTKKVFLPHNQTCYLKIIKVGNGTFTGSLKLNWHVNNSYVAETNKVAGSLRINKIILNEGNSNSIIRSFEYKNPTTNFSSGYNHGDELIPYTIIQSSGNAPESGLSPCSGTCLKTVLSNNSGIQLNVVNGKSVGYDYVKEIYHNESDLSQNYCTLFKFSNDFDTNQNLMRVSPIVPREDYSFMRGLLLQKSDFDNNSQIKSKQTNTYEFDNHYNSLSADNYFGDALISALKIDLINHCNINNDGGFVIETFGFDFKEYQIYSAWVKKTHEEVDEFFPSDTISRTKHYFYSPTYSHIRPIKVATLISTGDQIEERYEYLQNVENPVQIETYKNSTLLSKEKTIYATSAATSNILKPIAIYAAKFPNNLPNILPDIGTLEKRIAFDSYDDKGNLTQYSLENGSPVTLIWGYNKTQPIAKIENATNTQVASALNVGNLSTVTESSMESINNLRTDLPSAMVTTFTHKPLVGVSTITDPKGDTVTYAYDTAGRLEAVYDKNGNKLAENQYNYRPQN